MASDPTKSSVLERIRTGDIPGVPLDQTPDGPQPLYLMRLNSRQRRFVQEFCVSYSPGRAIVAAGFNTRFPVQMGQNYLRNPKIALAIREHLRAIQNHSAIEAARVYNEVAQIAFSDIRQLLSWDEKGNVVFKDSTQIDDNTAKAISEIKMTTGRFGPQLQVKMAPKLEALKLMTQLLGMTKDPDDSDGSAQKAISKITDAIQNALDNVYGSGVSKETVDAEFTEEPVMGGAAGGGMAHNPIVTPISDKSDTDDV